MVGAGFQARRSNPKGIELLRTATIKSPNDPVAWAALIYKEIDVDKYGEEIIIDIDDILYDIDKFEKIDSDNGLPLFFRSIIYLRQNKKQDVRNELIRSTQKASFRTYDTEIRNYLIMAAESIGYSRFTARSYAFIIRIGILSFSEFSQSSTDEGLIDKDAATELLEIGKRIEHQSKLNIELVIAFSLQSTSKAILGKVDTDNKYKEKWDALRKYPDLRNKSIPETRWVQFFNEALEYNEWTAFDKLYEEYGNSDMRLN
jgi:hypothetical protein